MMWVVPCRYDPIVHDCVDAIRTHFPGDEICLVDAYNANVNYVDELDVDHVIWGNRHHAWGAYAKAIDRFGARSYALIHDSLVVQSHWEPDDFQTLRWFAEGYPPPDQREWIFEQCDRLGLDTGPYLGVFGTIMWCSADTIDALASTGVFDIRPETRIQSGCMERVAGIAATAAGLDVTNSLHGRMTDFFADFPADRAVKHIRERP